MLKRRKFLIGGLIVFLALGFLSFMAFRGTATYYYTVSEILARGNSVYGENVRVNGQVAPGSVQQETKGLVLRFTIIDGEGGKSLPVVYQGAVPDSFKVGNEIVVEGHLNADGTFQANTLLPKCPSKYVPEK